MPASWRVEIHKSLAGEQWANDWLVNDVAMSDAVDVATQLVAFEQHVHMSIVNFDYVMVTSRAVGDRVFRHIPLNFPGLLDLAEYLPLYCTARFDMATEDSDSCRKYFRTPLAEGWQSNGIIAGGIITTLSAAAATYLESPGVYEHIRSPRGNIVTGGSWSNKVQMRQLHRHKRKKVV